MAKKIPEKTSEEILDEMLSDAHEVETITKISTEVAKLFQLSDKVYLLDEQKLKDINILSQNIEKLSVEIKESSKNFSSLLKIVKMLSVTFLMVMFFLGAVIVYITNTEIDFSKMSIKHGRTN